MPRNEFIFTGREKTKAFRLARFCSRSCANSREKEATLYKTIAFKHWKKECVVCAEDRIVEVHHIDHRHNNNKPQNLVPLCPTHHQYMHSRFRNEIEAIVEQAVKEKWAVGVDGGTRALQA